MTSSAISISLSVLTILLIATELIAAAYFYISAQHAFRFRLSCDQRVVAYLPNSVWAASLHLLLDDFC